MATIMDGKLVSQRTRERMRSEIAELAKMGVVPGLAVVMVGDDVGSKVYVRNKTKACAEMGMYSLQYVLPESTTQEQLIELVRQLNADERIHGILVQSPLPNHIDETLITEYILPSKDVDAFHAYNVGKIILGDYSYLPCTAAGIMEILRHYEIDPAGKHCVVIGRSHIVGKPMSMLMLNSNATVTVCHSYTENLAQYTRQADILIVAVGKAAIVTGDMIKSGAVVIDVGMNRDAEGKLCGDVDFASAEPIASYITPVPGGVGPMTITTLLQNTITAARNFATGDSRCTDAGV